MSKVGCVFLTGVVSMLPHAEFGPNDHRENAPHFTFDPPARPSNGALKCKNLTGGSKVGFYHVNGSRFGGSKITIVIFRL